jgi:hypothetical protein
VTTTHRRLAPLPTLMELRRGLFLAMVALLPLHTVFFSAWVSWKPFMIVLAAIGLIDLYDGWRHRSWPWHPQASIAATIFLAAALLSWPGTDAPERFFRLWFALVVGTALLLVVEKGLRQAGDLDRLLRVVFWSAAAVGATAVAISVLSVGTFGEGSVDAVNDLPYVFRVVKPAFVDEGFLAVTNWHQDPGYAATWTNLWLVLTLAAVTRGAGTSRRWLDVTVLGGLVFGVVMTFNRTGWLALVVAIAVAAFFLIRAGWVTLRDFGITIVGALAVGGLLLGALSLVDRSGVDGDVDTAIGFRVDQVQSLLGLEDPPAGSGTGPALFEGSEERFAVWPEYVDFFQEHPVRGVGLGVGWETTEFSQEPHNIFLELAGETGIVGLAGFAVLIGAVIYYGSGPVGAAALTITFAAALTQTVLFEAAWWFAAGIFLGGGAPGKRQR